MRPSNFNFVYAKPIATEPLSGIQLDEIFTAKILPAEEQDSQPLTGFRQREITALEEIKRFHFYIQFSTAHFKLVGF
jgi:hypothetical protein